MDRIKQFFGYLLAGLTAIIGILVYIIQRKDDELTAAKAKEKLTEADKKSALIDKDIEQLEKVVEETKSSIDKADTKLINLQKEKDEALKKEQDRTPSEVEDYWNK